MMHRSTRLLTKLTVHKSCVVDVESAQRREGLHIEAPSRVSFEDNACAMMPGECRSWGAGVFWGSNRFEGGIYMAASVADTSEVWEGYRGPTRYL